MAEKLKNYRIDDLTKRRRCDWKILAKAGPLVSGLLFGLLMIGNGCKRMQTVETIQTGEDKSSKPCVAKVKPAASTRAARADFLSGDVSFDAVSESAWARAEQVSFDTLCSNGQPVGPKTFVRFLWNDDKLFFYVEVEKTASPCKIHGSKLWLGSNIEFLVSPRWPAEPCLDEYEFLFNSNGGLTVLRWQGEGLERALQWSAPGLKWACVDGPRFQKDLDCWCFVGEVAFSAFGVDRPKVGEYWGLGLFRKISPVDGPEKLLAWSPTHEDPPRFHRPAKFGMLVFVDTLANR